MNSRDQPSNETTSNGGPHAFLLRLEMSLQTDPEECIRELDGAVIPEELHVRALWLRARALQAMRRPAETLPLLEEALSLARLRCDARMMAELEYLYSGVCFHLHSFDEALCHARLALEACSEDRDDRPLHGKIVMGLGHIHFIRGNFDEALGYYRRALTIFSSLRDLCSLGSLYSGMAGIYDAKGDHRKALQYAKRRVAAHEAIGDAWAAVEGQAVLATAYRGMNDLDRAEDVAKRALSRAQELGAGETGRLAHSALAAIYLDRKDYDRASSEASHVMQMTSDDVDPGRSEAITILAEVAEAGGRHEEADALYLRAIRALPASGNTGRLIEVMRAYSSLLEQRGDWDLALHYATQAAEVSAVTA